MIVYLFFNYLVSMIIMTNDLKVMITKTEKAKSKSENKPLRFPSISDCKLSYSRLANMKLIKSITCGKFSKIVSNIMTDVLIL